MWLIAHILIVLLAFVAGYKPVPDHVLNQEDMPYLFYLSVVVGFGMIPPLHVYKVVEKDGMSQIRWPSLNRNPFRWGSDPLQFVLVGTLSATGTIAGAALMLSESWPHGKWLIGAYVSGLAGLLVGYLVTIKIFRRFII